MKKFNKTHILTVLFSLLFFIGFNSEIYTQNNDSEKNEPKWKY